MITVEHLTKWYGGNRAVEDLCFVGEAKGLRGQALENQVFSALSRTGTMDVCRKALGSLSKGCRQRVGIAQANGKTLCTLPRAQVVTLTESFNAILLG